MKLNLFQPSTFSPSHYCSLLSSDPVGYFLGRIPPLAQTGKSAFVDESWEEYERDYHDLCYNQNRQERAALLCGPTPPHPTITSQCKPPLSSPLSLTSYQLSHSHFTSSSASLDSALLGSLLVETGDTEPYQMRLVTKPKPQAMLNMLNILFSLIQVELFNSGNDWDQCRYLWYLYSEGVCAGHQCGLWTPSGFISTERDWPGENCNVTQ